MIPQIPDTKVSLTDEQIAQIEQARKLIPNLKQQIRRAKSAGIDMADQEGALQALETQIDKLYRVYVRNVPTT